MTDSSTASPLILASTSPYRSELLARLGIPFTCIAPGVEESVYPDEKPAQLAARLAEAKARAVGTGTDGLIIGSDQVASTGDEIIGKPGTHEKAVVQLSHLAGKRVCFYTGLCLLNTTTGKAAVEVVPFYVDFRPLDEETIERYLRTERPYNCAGSFKSEGLGITLLERMEGNDPTALIGLPLIALTSLLRDAGIAIP